MRQRARGLSIKGKSTAEAGEESRRSKGIREAAQTGRPAVEEVRGKIIRAMQRNNTKRESTMVKRSSSTEHLKSKDLNIKRRNHESRGEVTPEAPRMSASRRLQEHLSRDKASAEREEERSNTELVAQAVQAKISHVLSSKRELPKRANLHRAVSKRAKRRKSLLEQSLA